MSGKKIRDTIKHKFWEKRLMKKFHLIRRTKVVDRFKVIKKF